MGDLPQNILEIIRNYLTVKDTEKKLFGEVFTPVELICEMLDKLPKEVWSNPDNKWLDPANGIGNFPLVAYYRLMYGLKDVVKDREERSKHIIENMLYMVELNPINCEVCKKIFKMIDGKANPNIVTADFLEEFIKTKNFRDRSIRFDIIMGNPPYNNSKSRNNPVYQYFCEKSINILIDNGLLILIHPPGWKRIYNEKQKSRTGIVFNINKNYWFKNIVLNLKQSNLKDKLKEFPEVDYYVLKKIIKNRTPTDITTNFNNNVYIGKVIISNDYDFLPNFINEESTSILNKLVNKVGKKFTIKNPREVVINKQTKYPSVETEKFKYPHYHYTKKGIKTFLYVTDDIKIKDFSKPKVIMSFNYSPSELNAWVDINGIYGTTDFGMYQSLENININTDSLVFFMNSSIIKFILKITQYASAPNTKNEFSILNLITIPEGLKENPTDQDIYDYYQITPEEQQLIEEVIYEEQQLIDKKNKW
jgi:hypothetical protein